MTENNLLLQSAHLRANYNYSGIKSDPEKNFDSDISNKNSESVNHGESGFCKKYCSPLIIIAFSGIIFIILLMFILMIVYH